jgi:hypothetical protein
MDNIHKAVETLSNASAKRRSSLKALQKELSCLLERVSSVCDNPAYVIEPVEQPPSPASIIEPLTPAQSSPASVNERLSPSHGSPAQSSIHTELSDLLNSISIFPVYKTSTYNADNLLVKETPSTEKLLPYIPAPSSPVQFIAGNVKSKRMQFE